MKKKNSLLANQRKKKYQGYQKEKNRKIPTYGIDGAITTAEKKKREKKLATLLFVLTGIIAFIYLPGYFLPDSRQRSSVVMLDTQTGNNGDEKTAENSVKISNEYLKQHPTDDFDGDGVLNSEEIAKGTNPWRMDTDRDFMTDSCELRLQKSNPLKADSQQIIAIQQKLDAAKGKKLQSPYKLGKLDVLLRADDWYSKSIGGVAQTIKGYNFCGFKGYVEFPEKGYCYSYRDGVHTLLPYNSQYNLWHVDNDNVEIFDEKLQEIVVFRLFGKDIISPSNFFTKFMAKILPDKGFIAAMPKMKIDTVPDGDDTTIDIQQTAFPQNTAIRFGNNNISIKDLMFVRDQIKNNICIAISLYHRNYGEFIGIIYGYDSRGNFYIADNNTLQPVGKLNIINTSYKYLDEKGDLVVYNYYEFVSDFVFNDENNHLSPFSSYNNDNINFFAASAGNDNNMSPSNSLLKKSIEETEKIENDHWDATTTQEETSETTESTTDAVEDPSVETEDTGEETGTEEGAETEENGMEEVPEEEGAAEEDSGDMEELP